MLLPWRAERRVGLCPNRLVLANAEQVATDDPFAELSRLGSRRPVTVVLSSHLVRYVLLPWSDALHSEDEWSAFAQHAFKTTYGAIAEGWHCRVSPARRGDSRIASAIDAEVLESLRSVRGVASVQPYLMSAFNARRRSLQGKNGWLVVQEQGRTVVALLRDGHWRLVRTRRIGDDWQERLPEILDREGTAAQDGSEEVFLYSEEEAPKRLGNYRVTDVTLSPGNRTPRHGAMAFH